MKIVKKNCSSLLIVFLIIITGTAAAEDINVELVGHLGGNVHAVDVVGNYAYIGQGQDFLMLDITNPSSTVPLNKITLEDSICDIKVSGNYAYIADGSNGLVIIDVNDLSSPIIKGTFDTVGYAYRVSVFDDYAYVIDSRNGFTRFSLLIIDVSNPYSPTLVGSYNTTGGASDVLIFGDYAYIADGFHGFSVIDISNPYSPNLAGSCRTNQQGTSFSISDKYAYVADGFNGLVIIDISVPSSPIITGSCDTAGYARSVSVFGNYAYIADSSNGLVIIDISNPYSPIIKGRCGTGGNTGRVWAFENYAYVTDSVNGLVIIDTSIPSSPILKGKYSTIGDAQGVSVSGSYAYVADGSNGLVIIDINNPSYPIIRGKYDTAGYAYNVVVSGNYAYVADGSNGLVIVDISNPSSPIIIGSCDTAGHARSVSVSGNYAYIADSSNGLVIIDISTPSSPFIVGSYKPGGFLSDISISDNYVYCPFYYGSLEIIDVSTPSSPTFVGSYKTNGYIDNIAVSNNYAYVGLFLSHDDGGGLLIINVSNPSSPNLVGKWGVGIVNMDKSSVSVSDNYAYVFTQNVLWIVDISDPSSPILAGDYYIKSDAPRISISDNYIYVANGENGFVILKTDIQNQVPITVGKGASTPEITQKFIDAYNRNGGLNVLGNPTTEVHSAFGFEVQDFPEMPATDGGVIMYNPNNKTAYFIHGAIWDKYYDYPEKAKLGAIASDEGEAAIRHGKTTGNYTKFETGTIHWISDVAGENINHKLRGKSFVTYGDLDKKYTEMGGTYSALGFPLMDQVTKADDHDYCMFEGGIIVWDDSTNAYKPIITPITIKTSFLPNPNGYKFENFGKYVLFTYKETTYTWDDEYSWSDFEDIYGDQDKYEYGAYTLTMLRIPHTKAYNFYDEYVKDVSNNGNCFGFSGSSLRLFKYDLIAYDPNTRNDKIPEGWNDVGPYKYGYSSKTVRDWIKYYTALMFSKASIEDRYTGTENVYNELRTRMLSDNWKQNSMIMCYSYDYYNKTSGEMETHGHAVVPYKMVEDGDNIKIYIYDSNAPNNFSRNISINRNTWQIADYDVGTKMRELTAISLDSLDKPPEIPDNLVSSDVVYASLLFTDNEGNKLGYYQGEFKDEIPDAKHIVEYSADSGSKSRDSYYIPDSSIKMELYGKNEGASDVTMLTPNGAITANVPVSANSLDEFKIFNDGRGVEFKSGSGTQSLNLTVSVETSDSAQIVYADFSQISAGRSIDLSNIDGTINIENKGQPITCSLHLAQLGINTSSNDSIENIVIEGESTIIVKPTDWNDLANSEITIEHDIGSDGNIDSTVVVNTPAEKLEDMRINVQGLVYSGELNKGQGNALTIKLDAAEKNLNAGNAKAATNELNAFINQVKAFAKTGKISAAERQALVDAANSVINAINR